MPKHIRVFNGALSTDFCRRLIAKFDADPGVEPDPQPDYSTRDFINISVTPRWQKECIELAPLATNLTAEYFHRTGRTAEAMPTDWFDDGYVLARYKPGDTCILHADGQCADPPRNGLRIATLLFYLNTIEEGGETEFPDQDIKVKPVEGTAVMFPVGFTHPHCVLPAKKPRYILQTWITDPDLIVLRADEIEYDPSLGIIEADE